MTANGKHAAPAEDLYGVFARIPLADLTISEGKDEVVKNGGDPAWWDETRMPVCFYFNVALGDYWDLTVGDHKEMVEYLKTRGLIHGNF